MIDGLGFRVSIVDGLGFRVSISATKRVKIRVSRVLGFRIFRL